MTGSIVLRRSLLMVSALRPEDFHAAVAAGPDMVCADLEDGTAVGRKAEARDAVFDLFREKRSTDQTAQRLLRINSPRAAEGMRDLLAIVDAQAPPDGVILPKVSGPDEVALVAGILRPDHPAVDIIALIEDPTGLRQVDAIAAAAPELKCLFFGSADYSAAIGSDMSWDALLYARSHIVNAAKEAGIDAMDGAWFDPHDDEGFREELRRVVAMGFTGKVSYEAQHVPHIHTALAPSPEAVEQARRVVATAEADTIGIARLDGRMVNESIVRSARRVLATAEHAATAETG